MRRIYSTLIAAVIAFNPALCQKLSGKEKTILKIVENNHPEALELLKTTVDINSGTQNFAGIKKVSDVMQAEFDAIGFETRWIDQKEANRAGHLFAEVKGTKGKRLLLIGHLDTVFPAFSPFQKWAAKDTLATGPGTNDMKGGNIVMLFALKALHEAGALDDARIIVTLHGDEEAAGRPIAISRADIVEAAKRSDIALGFEGSTGFNYGTIARRGSSGWRLEVQGKRAHSSRVFSEEVGAGAIFEVSRILNEFYNELSSEEYLTFNPGLIIGGTNVDYDPASSSGEAFGKSNVVSQKVVVTGGLRFLTEDQKEKAREKMREIVGRNLPQTSATITFSDGYPSMPPTEGNMKVLEVLNQVSIDMGHGPVEPYDPGARGAGDISFVSGYIDGLDGLGVMGGGAHSVFEFMDLRTVEELTKRAAILIYRLVNDDSK